MDSDAIIDGHQPDRKISYENEEEKAEEAVLSVAEEKLGPADAAPQWSIFYRSVRDAVAGLRSSKF